MHFKKHVPSSWKENKERRICKKNKENVVMIK